MLHLSEVAEVRWECVHFTSIDPVSALDHQLTERGIFAAVTDISTTGSLLGAIAKALRFPAYFGENWDALDECIQDMDWLPAAGCVLFVRGARQLWLSHPEDAGKLVEAWLSAAESWAQRSVPFHLVFIW